MTQATPSTSSTGLIALDWGTYRTLTEHAHLNPNQYETWLHRYYQATLLPNRTT